VIFRSPPRIILFCWWWVWITISIYWINSVNWIKGWVFIMKLSSFRTLINTRSRSLKSIIFIPVTKCIHCSITIISHPQPGYEAPAGFVSASIYDAASGSFASTGSSTGPIHRILYIRRWIWLSQYWIPITITNLITIIIIRNHNCEGMLSKMVVGKLLMLLWN